MASNEDDNFCRMQHLIDEMDRSNQRINLFSEKFDVEELGQGPTVKRLSPLGRQFDLLEDVCRSEESDGTSVHEIPPSHFSKNLEDSGCEEVINSAIAEVSKDFLSGLQTSGTHNQCGDSDESRISSDTDFKLIGGMPSYARYPETAAGLSDTDWNPYGTESDNNQSPHSQSAPSLPKESKSYATTPFLPILSSTGLNAITPNSDDKILSINSQQSHLSDIREVSERSALARHDLKPDVTGEKGYLTRKADWAITPQRGRRQQPSSILNQITKCQEQDQIVPHERDAFKTGHGGTSPKESVSSDEEKKMIASTSSTGYSSATSGTKANVEISKEKTTQDIIKSQHMSVFERAKLMGIPEDILFDKPSKSKAHFTNGRDWSGKVTSGGLSDYDSDHPLAHKVQHILSETAYLSSGAEKANYNKPTVDYNLLKKDLQEIQDNLESLSSGSPADLKKHSDGSPLSSDKEGDIPSTASTPDKNRNSPIWDFAEVIGSLASRIHPSGSHTQKSGMKRVSLNSDGDETRSSDSSHKSDDHIAVSESQKAKLRDLQTSHDIDQMLSTFRDQRHQLESRYQQLNNQGLAEKVFRILTNQDPESQANGILSEVSAEEKEMRAKMALKQHAKDFNFSSNSSLMEDSYRSAGLPDDIRKKLDLSGISSVDSSKVFDRSSFNLPSSSRGFSAFDDAKRLLSSQMAKASERTFNHSIEMKYPQTIQCYPLFMDKSNKEDGETRKEEEDLIPPNAVTSEETATETHRKDTSSPPQEDKPDVSPQELLGKEKHESRSSSDLGSISKAKEKYRPYRPPGSKEVYYTESDTASVADSVTTMESTHIGSDDAAGPHLPLSAYGSRKDAPNVDGIYGTRKNLSTVQEGTEPSSVEDKSSQDGKENKPSQIRTEEISSRHVEHGSPSQQQDYNGRSGRAVTTDRYSTSIWAKREEQPHISRAAKWGENSEQRVSANMLSHNEPGLSTHNVSAARRNARWANRMEEQNQDLADLEKRNVEGDRLLEHISSQRPSRFIGRDVSEAATEGQTCTNLREDFSLPANAFVSQRQNSPEEREPMSLRIKLAYSNTNKMRERSPERDESLGRFDNGLRSRFTDGDYNFRTSGRNRYEPDEHFMPHQNLVRSASDENLNATQRDARLSPAFRRALSPELMTSIGSRSPILGRSIERSLASPPSDYPLKPGTNGSTSPVDRRPYSLSDPPPTFLARERSVSPRQYVTSPSNEQRGNQAFGYTRDLSRSPQERLLSHDVRARNQHAGCDRYQTDERRQNSPNRYAPRHPSPTSFTRRQQPVERMQDTSHRYAYRRSSPGSVTKRKVELTLEGMSSESEADKEIDKEPISKRAQLLKDALSHEQEPNISPDINEMWDQFKAYNESDDSSINTARMEAVADLLKSPSTHLVSQYLKEREEYRIERQERVERENEKRMKEHVHKSSSSEDDLNERYQELLMAKEEERMKRRSVKKKKGKNGEPAKVPDVTRDKKKVGEDKCAESLYSIPEDRSFEQSPGKLSSAGPKTKPHVSSQPNVIDPNMIKLRDKISNQRNKVNTDMMKEIKRIDKLKKLEDLLKAKRKGQITSQMLEQQLEELSSTSHTVSDNSHDHRKFMEPNSTVLSDDSTTAKDSSGEMRMWKLRKENRHKDLEMTGEHGDKLRSKNSRSCDNKENKSKWNSTSRPKDLQRQSEMKLLKLVKEGYLTADEAYKVALARSGKEGAHLGEDMSATLSDNDSSFSTNRPHKFYSPYSRSPILTSQIRHVPKLKYSESLIDDSFGDGSYWLGNEKQAHRNQDDFRQSNLESRSSHHSRSSVKQGIQREDRDNNFISSVPGIYKRDRGRPRSQSPANATRQRQAGHRRVLLSSHQSPVRAHSTSPARSVKDPNNFPVKGTHGHFSRGRKSRSENDPSNPKKEFNRSVAWHIDMNSPPDQWKEPAVLQEIPLNKLSVNKHLFQTSDMKKKHDSVRLKKPAVEQNIWLKSHRPHGIPKLQWEEVVSQDALASKTNHWEVDPVMDRVQYILNKPSTNLISDQSSFTSGKDVDCAKSLSKLSLQEAFLHRKQDFISRCRERQKRLALSKEDRQMQECLRLEREAIFAEQERMGAANVYAHPYSDNLHQPKRRLLTKQEMREMTARKYKNLPEVIEKKEEDRKKIEYKLNRLRANLFNKKVQKEILKKRYKQRG